MIVGVITTRDVLSHPVTLISIEGVVGYLGLVLLALSRRRYLLLSCLKWVEGSS